MAEITERDGIGSRPPPPPPATTVDDPTVMPLVDHLSELRRRLFISVCRGGVGIDRGLCAGTRRNRRS